MTERTHKLFTYGTLRPKGAPSHRLHNYAMYNYGRFPFIMPREGGVVQGALLTVSDAELAELDQYESIDSGLYTREMVSVFPIAKAPVSSINAYVYVGSEQLFPPIIESGDWNNR